MELLANIETADLGKAIDFYGEALGLRVGQRFGGTAVELTGASSAIFLLKKAPDTRASSATSQRRDYRRHWTPVDLDFVGHDVEAARERAQSAGAVAEGPIHTNAWGRLALTADPFGHGFCLIQFLGRGYDEIADNGSKNEAAGSAR